MMPLSQMSKVVGKFISDNSTTILTAVAVTGVVSTTVLAVKATPAAYTDIQQAESERVEPLTPVEKVRLCWKYYVPAAAVGATTIACIIGANTISTKRQAALTSAYALSEKAFANYKEKVIEKIGETKEEQVRDEVAKDLIEKNPVSSNVVIMTNSGDVLCYDSLSGQYFNSSIEQMRQAQNDINLQCINEMYASQNDFYNRIGLPSTKFGEEFGWSTDTPLELDFSTQMSDDGRPCVVLDYRVQPNRGYHKFRQ